MRTSGLGAGSLAKGSTNVCPSQQLFSLWNLTAQCPSSQDSSRLTSEGPGPRPPAPLTQTVKQTQNDARHTPHPGRVHSGRKRRPSRCKEEGGHIREPNRISKIIAIVIELNNSTGCLNIKTRTRRGGRDTGKAQGWGHRAGTGMGTGKERAERRGWRAGRGKKKGKGRRGARQPKASLGPSVSRPSPCAPGAHHAHITEWGCTGQTLVEGWEGR